MSTKKIGRNDLCPCKSGKKYKKCCIGKDIAQKEEMRQRIIYGDEYVSDDLKSYADQLKQEFPDHEVIDVSHVVTNDTYKPLQLQHFKKKVIMLIEKLPENQEVFENRVMFEHVKYMVLYRGAYQCFEVDSETGEPDLEKVIDMIQTRLANETWKDNY